MRFGGRDNTGLNATAALAWRPLESDRAGLLFSYTRRDLSQQNGAGLGETRDRSDTLSTDGYYQATRNVELYGRFALKFGATSSQGLARVSTLRKQIMSDSPHTLFLKDTNGDGKAEYLRVNSNDHFLIQGTNGAETIIAGGGDDAVWGMGGNDRIEAGYGVDKIHGGKGDDILDFGSSKMLSWELFGNINAAEKTLGVDLDGIAKADTNRTFTTVVYGDSNNDGIADFAVALIGTKSITQDDFVTAAVAKTAAAPSMAYTAPLDFTVGTDAQVVHLVGAGTLSNVQYI